ncbi:carbohydrate ABC transporter substrate-binding protein [Endozoicomonas sp. SM1973]|uniref:Probable sugar-binding periplasmic protein n=1 Tax=Spartinivicinus marinus TaxID=2994442 RepID=A0A853I783_9GAMM|nr:ABC transporter substrate-binding protein [Spartinivicinus marinus]MCX4025843.1 ABC transporter substrate-binding protein [Spartinivicinus marinus]NYZ68659.1 carbohydrate ABC transporter substrate-binding protein [Spartinivicinus marinus]
MKTTIKDTLRSLFCLGTIFPFTCTAATTLTIESWRSDDRAIWQQQIIPAFEKKHPNIKLKFSPTSPAEYNAALNARLESDTAGDLITCRPFDTSLRLYQKGKLVKLDDVSTLTNFSTIAKLAWQTDDGKDTFCIPIASVIHGFIYNKQVFNELKLQEPTTEAEFLATLEKIKAQGDYIPLAMGTADQWEAATMGLQNIGPNYWLGEAGRNALINGTQKFSDAPYVNALTALSKWQPYLAKGYQAQTYSDSQTQFSLGRAAIYPAGSWEIGFFSKEVDFELGAFKPPVQSKGDVCYISDHTDIGIGINSKSKHIKTAKVFINWLGSKEFAELYSNALPGFFSLSNHQILLNNPLAKTFIGWRNKCRSTIRNSYQILSRGTPNLETQLWSVSANILNKTEQPREAAKKLQKGLDNWYKPKLAKAEEKMQ